VVSAVPSYVTELLARQASEDPHGLGLRSSGITLTFGELQEAATAVASMLKRLSLAPGEMVAIGTGDLPELVPSFFGVAAAGGVPVVLDGGSRATADAQLAHTKARIVIATPEMAAVWEASACVLLVAFGGRRRLECGLRGGHAGPGRSRFRDVACVLFTSGSTAEPKAIVWSEQRLRGALGRVPSSSSMGADVGGCLGLMRPITHSNSPLAMLGALAREECFALVDKPLALGHALAAMADMGVTRFSCTPAQAQLMLGARRPAFPTLRSVRVTGAPIDPTTLSALCEALSPVEVSKGYGLTEAGRMVTLLHANERPDKLASSGQALVPGEVEVVDGHGLAVPVGQEGEVILRLSPWTDEDGYLDAPEAVAASFRGGVLRTGDAGFFDDEGFLTIVGRRSDLIKVAGKGVSPSHIEEVLRKVPRCPALAVVGVPHSRYGEVAAVVHEYDQHGEPDGFERECPARLSGPDRPRWFLQRRHLPLSASGKVDTRQLAGELRAYAALWPAALACAGKLWPARPLARDETGASWLVDGAPLGHGIPLLRGARPLSVVREGSNLSLAAAITVSDGVDDATDGVRVLALVPRVPLEARERGPLAQALRETALALPGPSAAWIVADVEDARLRSALAALGFAPTSRSASLLVWPVERPPGSGASDRLESVVGRLVRG
jgi:acyl-CoA synthetase (AMP-forming)/AMP-acid ligase II